MRILVAGDPRSIHTARFTSLLTELGHEVHLFSVELQYEQEEQLRDLTLHVPIAYQPGRNGVRVEGGCPWTAFFFRGPPVKRALSRLLYADAAPGRVRGAAGLARLADSLAPSLIISLKMQNEGYTVAQAQEIAGSAFGPWLHFTWGTDIEFFGKHPGYAKAHLPLIGNALARCDFHIADTRRDLAQAVEHGFRGRTLGTMPAMGGFDIEWLRGLPRSSLENRDTILVKGRQGGYVGKAMNVVQAIRVRPDFFRRYRLRFSMASNEVVAAAAALREEFGMDSACLGRIGYEELMGWYGRAVVAVSASDVDGTPGFLLEAMAMGALPVHSDMASVREWVSDRVNARLFPVDDVASLCDALVDALGNRDLQAFAAISNLKAIEERANRARLREELRDWLAIAAAPA